MINLRSHLIALFVAVRHRQDLTLLKEYTIFSPHRRPHFVMKFFLIEFFILSFCTRQQVCQKFWKFLYINTKICINIKGIIRYWWNYRKIKLIFIAILFYIYIYISKINVNNDYFVCNICLIYKLFAQKKCKNKIKSFIKFYGIGRFI